MKILQYFENILEKRAHTLDVKKVKESILKSLDGYYKSGSFKNVNEAIEEIMIRLDIALIGATKEYANKRFSILQEALTNLGLNNGNNPSLEGYLGYNPS